MSQYYRDIVADAFNWMLDTHFQLAMRLRLYSNRFECHDSWIYSTRNDDAMRGAYIDFRNYTYSIVFAWYLKREQQSF